MDSTIHADISTLSTGFEQIRLYAPSEAEPDCCSKEKAASPDIEKQSGGSGVGSRAR